MAPSWRGHRRASRCSSHVVWGWPEFPIASWLTRRRRREWPFKLHSWTSKLFDTLIGYQNQNCKAKLLNVFARHGTARRDMQVAIWDSGTFPGSLYFLCGASPSRIGIFDIPVFAGGGNSFRKRMYNIKRISVERDPDPTNVETKFLRILGGRGNPNIQVFYQDGCPERTGVFRVHGKPCAPCI